MKKVITISSLLLGVVFLSGCSNKQQTSQTQSTTIQSSVAQNTTTNQPSSTPANVICDKQVKDADGKVYGTVKIGTQCWMAENMKVGVKIDGKSKPSNNEKIEKWCYDNNETHCSSDGGLYNWDEAMQYSTKEGTQGICPSGWHIPTDTEQYTLESYLKDSGQTCDSSRHDIDCGGAGKKLIVGGSSGMNFHFAGYWDSGSFYDKGLSTEFWSSSESNVTDAYSRGISESNSNRDGQIIRFANYKTDGYSVRCIKD